MIMVQINLKLRLSKIKYGIKVSYNTFEKATFDQFLMASVALRSESYEDAKTYIDNITGSGSLNAHFKQLYEKASKLDKNQLADIMNNSMYPMLKIDKSNSYDYEPNNYSHNYSFGYNNKKKEKVKSDAYVNVNNKEKYISQYEDGFFEDDDGDWNIYDRYNNRVDYVNGYVRSKEDGWYYSDDDDSYNY